MIVEIFFSLSLRIGALVGGVANGSTLAMHIYGVECKAFQYIYTQLESLHTQEKKKKKYKNALSIRITSPPAPPLRARRPQRHMFVLILFFFFFFSFFVAHIIPIPPYDDAPPFLFIHRQPALLLGAFRTARVRRVAAARLQARVVAPVGEVGDREAERCADGDVVDVVSVVFAAGDGDQGGADEGGEGGEGAEEIGAGA